MKERKCTLSDFVWRDLMNFGVHERFDKEKLHSYLSTLSERQQEIVARVLKETIYLSQNELVESLHKCLDRFESTLREDQRVSEYPFYNLYVPYGKIGSEHWFMLLLEERLRPVRTFWGHTETTSIDNDHPFLILDDAIYSSAHMCSIIDEFRYDTHIQNKFYCLVAVTSSSRPQVTQFNAEVIADRNLGDVRSGALFPGLYDELLSDFGCQTDCVLPFFMDHKIANEFGSYQFYHQIISPPVSRAPVDMITNEMVQSFIDRLREKHNNIVRFDIA